MNETKNNEQIFEEKAKNILEYLKSQRGRYGNEFMPRPFMIEFTGPPSAGKTTTIKELYDFLRPLGFKVWKPQEGADYIQDIPRTFPEYNVATAIYALEKLIHESFGHKYDIILFDRAIFDAYCWMEYWVQKDKLSPGDKYVWQSFFTSKQFVEKLDLVYFMICDPKVALERELRVAVSKRPRETTNPTSIEQKIKIWRNAYSIQSSFHPNIRLINTTNLSEQAMVDYFTNDILTVLELKSK
jgi:thymidylate kinase